MRNFTITIILLLLAGFATAQTKRVCATNEVHQHKLLTDKKYRTNQERIEKHYQQFLNSKANSRTTENAGTRIIPVYVHVIYNQNKPEENISNEQIQSQINVLNADYSATNSDIGNVPDEFAGVVANYQIQFEIIEITRTSSPRESWGTDDDMKKSSQGGVDPITPDTHLNMWVCEIGGGILGYAQFPGGSESTDGVVMSPQYFGTSVEDTNNDFYLDAPYDKGRTATHEVGHYLNLRHIWGDGGCSVDDGVEDTPIAGDANYNCPSYPSKSCTSNGGFTSDMFMNYMDYVNDDCMYMFTEGQKTRTASVFESGGARENLGYFCVLDALTGLQESNVTDFSFDLTWNAVTDAVSYDVSVNGNTVNVAETSYSVINLYSGTTYEVKVRPRCTEGPASYGEGISVLTTGSNCSPVGAFSMELVFDEYPDETSWELTMEGSGVIASGSGYGDSEVGTTLNESFNLAAGTYTFTIFDLFGDGICCSYGDGSYLLVDENGKTIVSGGGFGSSESTIFCVEGTASDNNLPVVENQVFSIDENTETGIVIGNIQATDEDGDNLQFNISNGNTNLFGLSQDGTLTVGNTALLNYETGASHQLTINVGDGNGGVSTAIVTVNVNDVNEAPYVADLFSFEIEENSVVNTIVGETGVIDEDGDELTFTIGAGNTNDVFAINANGELLVNNADALNFETISSYEFNITIDDGNGMDTTTTVSVIVNDVNDFPQIEDQAFGIVEYNTTGTSLGSVIATDEDGDAISFRIIGGNAKEAFAIDSSTGELTVDDESQLDLSENPFGFSLILEVNDGNEGIASANVRIDLITPVLKQRENVAISIYPNPGDELLHIGGLEEHIFALKIQLMNLQGQVVLDEQMERSEVDQGINIGNVKEGIYLLRLMNVDNENIGVYKYIKR